jgi:hypothetical protein
LVRASPATASATITTSTPTIWICSAGAPCSSCCRWRERGLVRPRSPDGSRRRPTRPGFRPVRRPYRSSPERWTCESSSRPRAPMCGRASRPIGCSTGPRRRCRQHPGSGARSGSSPPPRCWPASCLPSRRCGGRCWPSSSCRR